MSRESAELPEIGYRNRERDRKVAKRTKETEPMHFYHATLEKFNHGDVLKISKKGESIFLTDSPVPHKTISWEKIRPPKWWRDASVNSGNWNKEFDGKWYVYEVEPIGPIRYSSEFGDIQADEIKIIRFVGDGRAMLAHQEIRAVRIGKDLENAKYGSKVHGVERIREGKNKVEGHGRMHGDIMQLKYKLKEKREKNGL